MSLYIWWEHSKAVPGAITYSLPLNVEDAVYTSTPLQVEAIENPDHSKIKSASPTVEFIVVNVIRQVGADR